MKVLVLATTYALPNVNSTHQFVETRNKYYKKNGIEVVVLNFKAKDNYKVDGINVITLKEYKNNQEKYEDYLLISHAPNLKNHYIFLKKYQKNFKKLVFFFHGHEVLKVNKVYSKPYTYLKQNFL